MATVSEVRPSPIAGTWYTGDPIRLRRQVEKYLDEARLPVLEGEVVGVIAPHAGHRYSGRTAGHAFAAVRGQSPNLVVVMSPMHAPSSGQILSTAHHAYSTPLGPIWVDLPALSHLDAALEEEGLKLTRVANDGEHSLEIELPFLQVSLAHPFKLLPIMLRTHTPQMARQVGHALAAVLHDRSALLVASSDLSHFFTQEIANLLDEEMLRRIESFNPDDLFAAEEEGLGFACGVSAVAAVLWAAREMGADTVKLLHHSTSADETGDTSSVVGYGAAAILKNH
jgi:MEMO1 family protein